MRLTESRLRQIISEEIDMSGCVSPRGGKLDQTAPTRTIIVIPEIDDDIYGWCTNRVCGETVDPDDPHAPKRLVDIHRGDRVAILVHKPDEPNRIRTATSSLDGEWVIEGVVCDTSQHGLSMIWDKQNSVNELEDPPVREGYQISNRHLSQIISEEISRVISEGPVPDVSDEDMAVFQGIASQQERMLRRGNRGPRVGQLQRVLMSFGHELPRHGADEDFGNETRLAVRKFQRDQGLKVDGVVGPDTAEAFINARRGLLYTTSGEVTEQDSGIKMSGYVVSVEPDVPEAEEGRKSALLVGDSQMGWRIGDELERLVISKGWSPVRVPQGGAGNSGAGSNKFYKNGAQPSYWMRGAELHPALSDAIESTPPQLIIVSMGGNGPTKAGPFYEALELAAPGAEIVWIGAPPPVTPSSGSSRYVNTGDPKREVSRYRRTRAGYNDSIASSLGSGVTFIDPYESNLLNRADPPGGDGVHVQEDDARRFVSSEVSRFV